MVISHNSKTEDIVQLLRDDNIAMENVKILNRDQRTIKKENETRKNWIYECNEQRFIIKEIFKETGFEMATRCRLLRILMNDMKATKLIPLK